MTPDSTITIAGCIFKYSKENRDTSMIITRLIVCQDNEVMILLEIAKLIAA